MKPHPTFPLVPLHQLAPGQTAETFALLAERTLATTREGKPFFHCRFKDRLRTVSLMVWGDGPWYADCEKQWKLGTAFRLLATYGVHERFGAQVELLKWRSVVPEDRGDGFDPSLLIDSSRLPVLAMWQSLLAMIEDQFERPAVARLVRTIFQRYADRLQEIPASQGRFYPMQGGWVEHIYSLSQTCIFLADHYRGFYRGVEPALDRDLILAAALLHDIGRVLEFKLDAIGNVQEKTVPGALVGHVILGRDLVRRTAQELGDIPADFLERLDHLILSHLELPEWGSPRLPILPEALILHHADDLDAKLEMFMRCLSRDQNPGPFTSRDQVLGKALLKPGAWPDARIP
jgi:3'-5' exoribonuclease